MMDFTAKELSVLMGALEWRVIDLRDYIKGDADEDQAKEAEADLEVLGRLMDRVEAAQKASIPPAADAALKLAGNA